MVLICAPIGYFKVHFHGFRRVSGFGFRRLPIGRKRDVSRTSPGRVLLPLLAYLQTGFRVQGSGSEPSNPPHGHRLHAGCRSANRITTSKILAAH